MENQFLQGLKNESNFTLTTNGAITHRTTNSKVLDLFAQGAAMRNRSELDVILLFKNALEEEESLALKCLFYIRDIRGGQGERRFFRVCLKWLGNTKPQIAIRNLSLISEYGRWDDVLEFLGTKVEKEALDMLKNQLFLDTQCKAPSLLAKWLPSENASSKETRRKGNIVRIAFGLNHKEYRKALSVVRERINVLERLMSAGKWDLIEFDKIPSKAGLVYKNAFARRDLIAKKYETFAKDKTTKVNAGVLYPYEVVEKALSFSKPYGHSDADRAMINKYWENLKDYFNGREMNGIAVIDTSGSMNGKPLNVAISLGMYIAERSGGPFANHFITFSSRPELVEFEGIDFVDKVKRCNNASWQMNTNIEAVFDLLLKNALATKATQDDLPQNIYIVSDMEFDSCAYRGNKETLMEGIAKKWAANGYEMPKLIFWNVNAHQANIPVLGVGRISFVSGFSPSIFDSLLSGKSGYELMLETLLKDRYTPIQ